MKVFKNVLFIFTIHLIFSYMVLAESISFEQDRSVPLVYMNVAIKTGAAHDPKGKFGVSNFTAEMMLRGTHKRTKEQIDLELDQMGAMLEVETRVEAIIFRGAVLSSQLTSFLELFEDILVNPSFPNKEIQKLKKELISGLMEQQGSDSSLASQMATQFLFAGHPYGTPVIGTIPDIEKFDLDSIKSTYSKIMNAKNILFLGTGDSDEITIQNWSEAIVTKAKKIQNAAAILEVTLPQPKQRTAPELLIIDKPERTQTQIFGGQIGVTLTNPDYFPLYLANYSFGGGSFSSRLMVEIRVKKGWSYGANSNFRHGILPRSWMFHLFPAEKDTPEAAARTVELITEFKENGLKEEEFNFAKQSLINSAGFSYNTPKKRVENLILEKTLNLPSGFMKSYAANLEKIDRERVNTSVKNFVKADKLALTILGTAANIKKPLMEKLKLTEEQVKVIDYRKNLEF